MGEPRCELGHEDVGRSEPPGEVRGEVSHDGVATVTVRLALNDHVGMARMGKLLLELAADDSLLPAAHRHMTAAVDLIGEVFLQEATDLEATLAEAADEIILASRALKGVETGEPSRREQA